MAGVAELPPALRPGHVPQPNLNMGRGPIWAAAHVQARPNMGRAGICKCTTAAQHGLRGIMWPVRPRCSAHGHLRVDNVPKRCSRPQKRGTRLACAAAGQPRLQHHLANASICGSTARCNCSAMCPWAASVMSRVSVATRCCIHVPMGVGVGNARAQRTAQAEHASLFVGCVRAGRCAHGLAPCVPCRPATPKVFSLYIQCICQPLHMWSSFPCTAWCMWVGLNKFKNPTGIAAKQDCQAGIGSPVRTLV